jgi:plasmid stability protein
MMAQVLVRDLPDDVVERLKAQAEAQGSSLEAHLRRLLADASALDRSGLLALADEISASTAGRVNSDATALVRVDRERDER